MLLVTAENKVTPFELPPDDQLRALYDALRCELIQVVGIGEGIEMIVDEEALLPARGGSGPEIVITGRKPLNMMATLIAGGAIFGDVVLLRKGALE